jgi:hypothetical protein
MSSTLPRIIGIGMTAAKIRYTSDALQNDIGRLQKAWRKYRRSRRRSAIYRFLDAVFQIAIIWHKDGKLSARSRNALAAADCALQGAFEPFRALVAVAAQSQTLEDRTLSKWSRVLQFAKDKKLPSTPLRKFIKRYGGVNDCAAEFTRRAKRSGNAQSKDFEKFG